MNGEDCQQRTVTTKGYWGVPKLDNTHIDRPPALPKDVQNYVFDLAKILKFGIPEKYRYGDAPRSPKQQGWWQTHLALHAARARAGCCPTIVSDGLPGKARFMLRPSSGERRVLACTAGKFSAGMRRMRPRTWAGSMARASLSRLTGPSYSSP
jgi:hypothetical protein